MSIFETLREIEDLIITIPSILQMLGRFEEAFYVIERCVRICEYFELNITLGKLWLIEASMLCQ
jgi:hypothetical protein